jgi:hypothetical protein
LALEHAKANGADSNLANLLLDHPEPLFVLRELLDLVERDLLSGENVDIAKLISCLCNIALACYNDDWDGYFDEDDGSSTISNRVGPVFCKPFDAFVKLLQRWSVVDPELYAIVTEPLCAADAFHDYVLVALFLTAPEEMIAFLRDSLDVERAAYLLAESESYLDKANWRRLALLLVPLLRLKLLQDGEDCDDLPSWRELLSLNEESDARDVCDVFGVLTGLCAIENGAQAAWEHLRTDG